MTQTKTQAARGYIHPYLPILIIVAVNLVLGALLVRDYGESWDEDRRIRYANKSIQAYQGIERNLQDEKGAFYVMVARLGADLVRRVYTNWQFITAWHFFNFLAFVSAIFFFYVLCLRLVRPGAAVAATLLFNTQPLLWGHAFINPKDIPFMAFFLASVASGLVAFGAANSLRLERRGTRWSGAPSEKAGNPLPALISTDWRAKSPGGRWLLAAIGLVSVAALSFLVLAGGVIRSWITLAIGAAYAAGPQSWSGRLFSSIAGNAHSIPVESYISKALALYARLGTVAIIVLLAAIFFVAIRLFPSASANSWRVYLRPFFARIAAALTDPRLLLAGVLLGLCSAIRTIGPFAGALVGGYALWKGYLGKKALWTFERLIVYAVIAALTAYLAWPYLWGAPVAHFLASFATASDYPFESQVLFAGRMYDQAPWTYFPVLLAIQISGTALLAILLGLGVALVQWLKNSIDAAKIILLLAWFILPPAAAILLKSTMYDNFRQFLFVVPPLFAFSAIGFQFLFDKIRFAWVNALIVALLLLPNILAIVNLHPYEYVYYNALVGGTRGAFRRYEMDYWATSYKEAVDYLNQNAPPGSTVVAWGPTHLVRKYIRPDIEVNTYQPGQPENEVRGDFIVISSRENADQMLFPYQPAVFEIGRDGAIFTVIRQLPAQNKIAPPP